MATFSVYARGDSSTANNASLNAMGTSSQPTVMLTFSTDLDGDGDDTNDGGDLKLEFNDGSPDPDTVIYADFDGDGFDEQYSFTLEFGGTLPFSNKLSNVNGVDLRGEEIYVLTLDDGTRLFFLSDYRFIEGTGDPNETSYLNLMNAFPNGAHNIGNIFACYAAGTEIATPGGVSRIEDLKAGDRVLSADGLDATVLYVASQSFSAAEVRAFKGLQPVVVPAGSLRAGEPATDLTVSPLHRIMIDGADLQRLFGLERAYVAARDLLVQDTASPGPIVYVHVLCDRHAALIANGCASESLYPGDVALLALSEEDRQTVNRLTGGTSQATAYPCLTSREAAVWRAALQSREKRTA